MAAAQILHLRSLQAITLVAPVAVCGYRGRASDKRVRLQVFLSRKVEVLFR